MLFSKLFTSIVQPHPPLRNTMASLQWLFFMCLAGTGTIIASTNSVSTTPSPSPTSMDYFEGDLLLPYSYTLSSHSNSHVVIVSPTPFDSSSADGMDISGSGSGYLISTTSVTEPMNLPTIYVSLAFTNLPLESFRPTVMIQLAKTIAEILDLNSLPVIVVDSLLSSDDETVLSVYFPSSESSNVHLFPAALERSDDPNWLQIKRDYELVRIEAVNLIAPLNLSWWNWLIIATCPTIAVTAFLLLCFACCYRHKLKQRKKKTSLANTPLKLVLPNVHSLALQDREQVMRKISRISYNPRGKMPVLSHPLSIYELEQLVANPMTLNAEYASMPTNMASKVEVPPGAEEKNRYNDVLPNAYTRVSLYLKFGVPNSDYINANFIRGYQNVPQAYIATQGPLYWTVADFWRMLWEQKCSVIVMVTGLEEKGVAKCSRYWSDERIMHSTSYEDLEVALKRRTVNKDFTTTIFHLRHKQKMVSREVTHFWYTSWPDHGVPSSTQPIIDFLLHARKYIRDIPGPVIVHCSAGIGRSGVFIGADIGMKNLEEKGEVDVLNIVSSIRQDRGGMVQTREQYLFLHKVLLQYAHMVRSPYRTGQRSLEPMQEEPESEETASLLAHA